MYPYTQRNLHTHVLFVVIRALSHSDHCPPTSTAPEPFDRPIALSSAPCPLCPRFLPGNCKKLWCPEAGLASAFTGASPDKSPNLEKRPRFFGFISSFSPTSSNPSSTGSFGLSRCRPWKEGREAWEWRTLRESRLWRGRSSKLGMGDRAEIS